MLGVLLEGEGLFNDASSLTLFEAFSRIVVQQDEGFAPDHVLPIVEQVRPGRL